MIIGSLETGNGETISINLQPYFQLENLFTFFDFPAFLREGQYK
jgi:hypothetical protein